MADSTTPNKKVVIIGGGFGGMNAAKGLVGRKGIDVLLIDRRNHHLFQPLLYQVAMAGLSPADIATPIRSVFRHWENVRVLMTEVKTIDRVGQKVITDTGEYPFDYLVLACGAEHSYFGHQDWEDNAPGLKTVEQATEIRRRVLLAFEKAEALGKDPDQLKQWLTFVVIGGGPTGVELAGALGEITRYTLSDDFRSIDPSAARVILIEAGPRILTSFHEELGKKAKRDLENLGVQLWTNCRVTDVSSEGVKIGPEWVAAKTVIWAAGVKPSSLNLQLGAPLDKIGRVTVMPDASLAAHKNIFVIGDQAYMTDKKGNALPGLAPVAMQQGRFVAKQIKNDIRGKARTDFYYVDKGSMATIGRRKAVGQIGNFRFTGLFAWYMWLLIHVYFLIGFKNRVFVLWQWFYSYVTYKRGARLITARDWHMEKVPKVEHP